MADKNLTDDEALVGLTIKSQMSTMEALIANLQLTLSQQIQSAMAAQMQQFLAAMHQSGQGLQNINPRGQKPVSANADALATVSL